MELSIDIVIPSFRLRESFVLPLLSLEKPENAVVRFFLVVDNPSIGLSPGIAALIDNENIFLIKNAINLGAGESRNRGIDKGSADWILLLDDDIVPEPDLLKIYAEAVQRNPSATGYIGLITLPEPVSDTDRAIVASGSMDIFNVAVKKQSHAWGATANFLVRRSAIGGIRFNSSFPKSGGGEDVDFFLRVREENLETNYECLPAANVFHPWWNTQLNPLRRPFRYGRGNALLAHLNPRYTYYDWLNTPETILLTVLLAIVMAFIRPGVLASITGAFGGILLIELVASGIQTIKRSRSFKPAVIWYAACLRLAEQSGVLWERLSKGRLNELGKRFHDDGTTGSIAFYRSSTYRIVKWMGYPLLVWILWKKHS